MSLDELNVELEQRRAEALKMGGEEKLAARRKEGTLNARERIEQLIDPGSFWESGQLAASIRPEMRDRTPADGKISGFGRVNGRELALVSNDFTVLGASSSTVNARKMQHIKETSEKRGLPIVFFGESTGARMPDVMGASSIGSQRNPTQYLRRRSSPWISAILGHCYGSASWYACMSDIVVMRRGARMAVASPRLSAMATGEAVDEEELAGWRLHATASGLVDVVVDTDQEALEVVRQLLSYLPSHVNEAPPTEDYKSDEQIEAEQRDRLGKLVPTNRTQAYDMRKVVACIFDQESVFELKSMYGKSMVTAFARIEGQPVGVIANNPMFKGGAIDAEACTKVTSFIVLCDSYNIPIILLTDQPGFLIGLEGEKKAMPGRVMNWMNALSLCTVPRISIVARKTYGQAVLNMGLGGNCDEAVAWTTGEIGFMDPNHGATIVYGVTEQDDPEEFQRARTEMARDTSPFDAAAVFSVQEVIDPRDTRAYLKRALRVHNLDSRAGVGEGHMRNWPTTVI